jgi:hypothetical protein
MNFIFLEFNEGTPILLQRFLGRQWRYSIHTDKTSAAMQIAERVHALALEQNEPSLMIEAYRALACTLLFSGDIECARQYAMRAVQIWRAGEVQFHSDTRFAVALQMLPVSVVACLCHLTPAEWHLGEIACCQANMVEANFTGKEAE